MTWKDFKARVENLGVKDEDVIQIQDSAAGEKHFEAEDVQIHRESDNVEIY